MWARIPCWKPFLPPPRRLLVRTLITAAATAESVRRQTSVSVLLPDDEDARSIHSKRHRPPYIYLSFVTSKRALLPVAAFPPHLSVAALFLPILFSYDDVLPFYRLRPPEGRRGERTICLFIYFTSTPPIIRVIRRWKKITTRVGPIVFFLIFPIKQCNKYHDTSCINAIRYCKSTMQFYCRELSGF